MEEGCEEGGYRGGEGRVGGGSERGWSVGGWGWEPGEFCVREMGG